MPAPQPQGRRRHALRPSMPRPAWKAACCRHSAHVSSLCGHRVTGLRTTPALFGASLHPVEFFAASRASFADDGASAASMLMELGTRQHQMRACATHLRARHHGPEVFRLDMLPASLQAMVHCFAKADSVAAQALVNAVLHFGRRLLHAHPSSLSSTWRWPKGHTAPALAILISEGGSVPEAMPLAHPSGTMRFPRGRASVVGRPCRSLLLEQA